MTIAERIRDLRKAAGLSQAEAAEQLGATQGYWSHIETGISIPTEGQLLRIAHRLGWPIESLDPSLARPAVKASRKPRKKA